MIESNFKGIVSSVAKAFNRKSELADRNINYWFHKLEHIPDDAGKFIENFIIDNHSSFPKNMIMAIKEAFSVYCQQERGGRGQANFSEPCNKCFGMGWLELRQDRNHKEIARCGDCNNWKGLSMGASIPRWSVSEAINAGFQVVDNRQGESDVFLDLMDIAAPQIKQIPEIDIDNCKALAKRHNDGLISKRDFCLACQDFNVHPYELQQGVIKPIKNY